MSDTEIERLKREAKEMSEEIGQLARHLGGVVEHERRMTEIVFLLLRAAMAMNLHSRGDDDSAKYRRDALDSLLEASDQLKEALQARQDFIADFRERDGDD